MVVAATFLLGACSASKSTTAQNTIGPVCGMKVEISEAFSRRYDGKKYYFDKYACAETFKMTPEKYVNKNSDAK